MTPGNRGGVRSGWGGLNSPPHYPCSTYVPQPPQFNRSEEEADTMKIHIHPTEVAP